MQDLVGFTIALLISSFGLFLTLRRSPWLVDYLFYVIALNRGVRRVVDWMNGEFNKYSFISLTPILIGGLASVLVLYELNARSREEKGRYLRKVSFLIYLYLACCSVAFVIGFIHVGFGAVYAFGDYLAPVGLMGFAALYVERPRIIDQWCNSLAFSSLLVAGYGIYQFYTIPPWDAFWVRAVDFEGYLGELESTRMTLFSTMNERGPAAMYLGNGLTLLVLRPGTLGWLRWPSAAVILIALLLTYVRFCVIQFSLACLLLPILNRGTGTLPIVCLCVGAFVFGESLMKLLPGNGAVSARMATLSNIQDDDSFRGRLILMQNAARSSLGEPFGLGIGAHGMASRLSTVESGGGADSTGYVEALRTFGWTGLPFIMFVLYQIWVSSRQIVNRGIRDPNVYLFRAWFVSGLVGLFAFNWLFTATFFWVLAGYVVGRSGQLTSRRAKPLDNRGRISSSEKRWDAGITSPPRFR